MLIADVEAVDSRGRVVARGTGTFMRSEIPLGPKLGYA
jgi:acyl-coenzyme A thioesterase PaaI-like protein